jgi:hypothetical protein
MLFPTISIEPIAARRLGLAIHLDCEKRHSMAIQDRNGVRIDSVHSGAICAEIGERLRASLAAAHQRWPTKLNRLTEQLDTVERRDERSRAQSKIDPR